jgi:hypothetical protein
LVDVGSPADLDELRRWPLVVVGAETTGLHWDLEPWDIAFIRRGPDGTETRLQMFVEVDLRDAEPDGLAFGFLDRHPLGQWLVGRATPTRPRPLDLPSAAGSRGGYVTAEVAAGVVAQWTHGAVLVGMVPSFAASVFEVLLRRHGLSPAWHHQTLCVETAAFGFLRGLRAAGQLPDTVVEEVLVLGPPWHPGDLSWACGVEPAPESERHTAAGDCEWALRWWDRMHSERGGPVPPPGGVKTVEHEQRAGSAADRCGCHGDEPGS